MINLVRVLIEALLFVFSQLSFWSFVSSVVKTLAHMPSALGDDQAP
jgi:hypothetical protein